MGVVLGKLYGMQPDLEAKLRQLSIKDSSDLLRLGKSPDAVVELARALDVEPSVIVQLMHRAELAQIRGVGGTYTMLLEKAGIHTLRDLAASSPEDLQAQFSRINSDQRLVGRVPALAMVNGWISKARRLPSLVGNYTSSTHSAS